jgi:hypothetical protein
LQEVHPGFVIVGLVVFILGLLTATVCVYDRMRVSGTTRRKKTGAKKAKRERMMGGLQPAGES